MSAEEKASPWVGGYRRRPPTAITWVDSLGQRVSEIHCAGLRVAHVRHAARATMPWHAHRHASLTLVLAGRFEESTDGAAHRLASLSVVYKPPGLAHATRVGTAAASSINVSIPQTTSRRLGLPELTVLSGGPLAMGLIGVSRMLTTSPVDALGVQVDRCLEALGASAAGMRTMPDPLVDEAGRWIAAGDSIGDTARRLAVDPATLWRRFRRQWGVTPSAWRRRTRVVEAAAWLAETGESIAAVAAAAGFADQSHLTRDFCRETGLTPRAFRALVRDSCPVRADDSQDPFSPS